MPPWICLFCRKIKSQESGLTFHKFPLRDQDLLKQWLNNIPLKNWAPTRWTVLCSNHFAEDCFKSSEEGRVLLKPNSIPTRFDNPQSCCIYCKRKRTYKSGHSFYKFPLHKSDILKKWLDNMGIKNWIPNNSSLLCSEHFEETCFQKKGKKKGKNLFLKERSVPTIFKTECLNDIQSAVLTSIEPSTSGTQLDTAHLDTAQLDTSQLQNSEKPLDTGHYSWWYPIEMWSVGILPSSIIVDNGNPLGTNYYGWWYPIEACSIGILPLSTIGFLQ